MNLTISSFNTAVSQMMILLNSFRVERKEGTQIGYTWIGREDLEIFIKLLAPFAPHMAEELWQQMGHKKSIHLESWPQYDSKLIVEDQVSVVVQVNGKHRGTILVAADSSQDQVEVAAKSDENVNRHLE